MKIKKGDNVIIRTGKDKGKSGVVVRVISAENKVIVENMNMMKKASRPKRVGRPVSDGQTGGLIDVAMPIHISNVMIVDPQTKKPTRIGFKMEGDKKVRIAKKSGKTLSA